VPRIRFDAALHDAAAQAGAEIFVGRAAEAIDEDGVRGFRLSTGIELRADGMVGADGATSRVAEAAGLVDARAVLWGFALRGYVDEPVDAPHIVLWEPERWHAFPGYAWLFPGPDGRSNVGLGVGVLADRTAASAPARQLSAFIRHLRDLGLLRGDAVSSTLGGWLKLGMVGTIPARGRVLLVGDAAGLVNPLQGEGIAPALHSAQAAAEAVL